MSDFVGLETVRLDLPSSDGKPRWIVIKAELGAEETERLSFAGISSEIDATGRPQIDWVTHRLAKLEIWLVDWSLVDATGRTAPVNKATIGALKPALMKQIETAIDDHQRELDEQALNPTGARLSAIG